MATSMLSLNCLNAVNKMSSIEVGCHSGALFNGKGVIRGGGGCCRASSQGVPTKDPLPGSAAAGDVELFKQAGATGGNKLLKKSLFFCFFLK